jgi:hypothetical protein
MVEIVKTARGLSNETNKTWSQAMVVFLKAHPYSGILPHIDLPVCPHEQSLLYH